MKKLITFSLLLLTTLNVKAKTLTATSLTSLVKDIQAGTFQYKERGMIFGFNTIQSCLYLSEDIAILKNYCFPAKPYPARGYTIISKSYGMIDLYEESFGAVKRDVIITQFPEVMAPYLTTQIPNHSLPDLSAMIEKMYYRHFPGCWSTNYSRGQETPTAACSVGYDVVNFAAWADETQSFVNNEVAWSELMDTINSKLQ